MGTKGIRKFIGLTAAGVLIGLAIDRVWQYTLVHHLSDVAILPIKPEKCRSAIGTSEGTLESTISTDDTEWVIFSSEKKIRDGAFAGGKSTNYLLERCHVPEQYGDCEIVAMELDAYQREGATHFQSAIYRTPCSKMGEDFDAYTHSKALTTSMDSSDTIEGLSQQVQNVYGILDHHSTLSGNKAFWILTLSLPGLDEYNSPTQAVE